MIKFSTKIYELTFGKLIYCQLGKMSKIERNIGIIENKNSIHDYGRRNQCMKASFDANSLNY